MGTFTLRHNNPGAIMFGPFASHHGATKGGRGTGGTLAHFRTPAEGFAAVIALQNDYQSKGYRTLAQRIERWSPAKGKGNSAAATRNYINRLASAMGINPNTPFDINDPILGPKFLAAQADFEAGKSNSFSPADLQTGLQMARDGLSHLPPTNIPNASQPPPSAPLGMGRGQIKSGPAVSQLQQQLADAGLYKGKVDGLFGRQTAAAVRAAETTYGLNRDRGIAGPQVQAALAGRGPVQDITDTFRLNHPGEPAGPDVNSADIGFGRTQVRMPWDVSQGFRPGNPMNQGPFHSAAVPMAPMSDPRMGALSRGDPLRGDMTARPIDHSLLAQDPMSGRGSPLYGGAPPSSGPLGSAFTRAATAAPDPSTLAKIGAPPVASDYAADRAYAAAHPPPRFFAGPGPGDLSSDHGAPVADNRVSPTGAWLPGKTLSRTEINARLDAEAAAAAPRPTSLGGDLSRLGTPGERAEDVPGEAVGGRFGPTGEPAPLSRGGPGYVTMPPNWAPQMNAAPAFFSSQPPPQPFAGALSGGSILSSLAKAAALAKPAVKPPQAATLAAAPWSPSSAQPDYGGNRSAFSQPNVGAIRSYLSSFGVSPGSSVGYTPQGYKSPNFSAIGGGSIYAYKPDGNGGGSYYDSNGNKHSY